MLRVTPGCQTLTSSSPPPTTRYLSWSPKPSQTSVCKVCKQCLSLTVLAILLESLDIISLLLSSSPQGYQFEEDNPYLAHQDLLAEGVRRMEAGDIPGAVRLFESAVQREPENQLVRISNPGYLKPRLSQTTVISNHGYPRA